MNMDLNKWSIIIATVSILFMILDARRIFLAIIKENFLNLIGYENNFLSKVYMIFDSLSRIFFFLIYGTKEFYRLNGMISSHQDFLEGCMFVAIITMMINMLIVVNLRKKYRIEKN